MAVPVSAVPAAVNTVQEIETELLLEALYRMYGTDLREMDHAALRPRLVAFMRRRGLASLSAVQAGGSDPVVKTAAWDARATTFTVPGRTVAVFVQGR